MAEVKSRKFEYVIFTSVLFLICFGLIVLYSASSSYALKMYGNSAYLLVRQAIFCTVGLIITIVVSFIPYKLYIKFANYFFIACLVLVIVTTFAGRISRGSSRWIELRGFIFQPSELMKCAMIIYLSKVLSETFGKLEERDKFMRVMMVAYIPTFIVALNNLSTGIILFCIATTMIFVVSKKKLIFIFIITLIVLFYVFAYPMSKVLYNMGLLKQYQVGRIFAWKDPENYQDIAYQTLQGLYAVGSGRISGRGYMNSIQKGLIPESQNDMIFAIICEELGIVGAYLFLVLYIVLISRILYLSFKSHNIITSLMLLGIGVHIAIQVIFNIGVVTNLLPNTGVTLPFVSYGGSSLMVLFIEIGIILSISKKILNE